MLKILLLSTGILSLSVLGLARRAPASKHFMVSANGEVQINYILSRLKEHPTYLGTNLGTNAESLVVNAHQAEDEAGHSTPRSKGGAETTQSLHDALLDAIRQLDRIYGNKHLPIFHTGNYPKDTRDPKANVEKLEFHIRMLSLLDPEHREHYANEAHKTAPVVQALVSAEEYSKYINDHETGSAWQTELELFKAVNHLLASSSNENQLLNAISTNYQGLVGKQHDSLISYLRRRPLGMRGKKVTESELLLSDPRLMRSLLNLVARGLDVGPEQTMDAPKPRFSDYPLALLPD
jgi:hypothetical protein